MLQLTDWQVWEGCGVKWEKTHCLCNMMMQTSENGLQWQMKAMKKHRLDYIWYRKKWKLDTDLTLDKNRQAKWSAPLSCFLSYMYSRSLIWSSMCAQKPRPPVVQEANIRMNLGPSSRHNIYILKGLLWIIQSYSTPSIKIWSWKLLSLFFFK